MSLPLHAALAVKLLCWLLALAVFFRLLARHSGFTGPQRRRLLGAMVLGALAGSKAVYALTYPGFFAAPQDLIGDSALAFLSGDSSVGALIGGRLALWFADRQEGGGREADGLVVAVVSALLVLSLGAFFWALRGTGFGSPTSLPWGVDFGDGALRHPVMLYVFATPESPYMQSLYTPEQNAQYLAYLGQFRGCAKVVLVDKTEAYGLGNRHFINRSMEDDFPYRFFDKDGALPTKDEVDVIANRNNLYDLDHLNLVGATRFTRELLTRFSAVDPALIAGQSQN